jgi:hypothetical protein
MKFSAVLVVAIFFIIQALHCEAEETEGEANVEANVEANKERDQEIFDGILELIKKQQPKFKERGDDSDDSKGIQAFVDAVVELEARRK